MKNIYFKYNVNKKLPEYIHNLTDEMIGYSKLDDSPIYSITFNNINGILYKIYDKYYDDRNIYDDIKIELRTYKIKNIYNKEINQDKYYTFLQFFYDNKMDLTIIN